MFDTRRGFFLCAQVLFQTKLIALVVFNILVFYVKYLWDYLVLMTHGHGFFLLMYHVIFCIHLQGRCNGHGNWTALKGCEDVNNYPSIAFRIEMLNVCFKLF